MQTLTADLVLFNGRIATQDDRRSMVQAVAIKDGRVLATGSDAEISRFQASGNRSARPHGDPGADRLALASDPRRPVLQPRAALGRRAVARRRAAHAARAGAAHAAATTGCAWWAAGRSSSSPRSACRRWRSSTPPRPIRRCSCSTSMRRALLNRAALRAVGYDKRHARIRPAARSSATAPATPPAC